MTIHREVLGLDRFRTYLWDGLWLGLLAVAALLQVHEETGGIVPALAPFAVGLVTGAVVYAVMNRTESGQAIATRWEEAAVWQRALVLVPGILLFGQLLSILPVSTYSYWSWVFGSIVGGVCAFVGEPASTRSAAA